MKITAQASSDVALIKYWGKKDEVLRLPENGSISLILDGLNTITTVEFSPEYKKDEVMIQGEVEDGEVGRVQKHLDRIRALAHTNQFAKVVSQNTFPKGTGLSSSGSGFAALTLAATSALNLSLNEKELSILARQGSGTACRCMCGGVVEWLNGDTSDSSYSVTRFSAEYWQDIVDVIAVVSTDKKIVSSTEGHTTAKTSSFFEVRQQHIEEKLEEVKRAIQNKNFRTLGELVEAEALEFHSILFTSKPALIAWHPGTIEVMLAVQQLRREGVEAYFTINTGFNVHVLTLEKWRDQVKQKLDSLALVQSTLIAKIGDKPSLIDNHLF